MANVAEIVGRLRLTGGDEFNRQIKNKADAIKQSFATVSNAIAAGGIFLFLRNVNEATNALVASQQKLSATSRLTGVSLSSLSNIAKDAEKNIGLSTKQSNEFTIAITKLTQKAGDIGKTGDAIGRLLDLAAAQGLGAEQALISINQAILGIDEGTDKLFQKNPSVIYAEFAKQIGVSAGKLTDQQKAQALLNAVMTDGLKVQGEWQKRLQTGAGAQEKFALTLERMREKVGETAQLIGMPLINVLERMVSWFNQASPTVQRLIISLGAAAVALKVLGGAIQALFVSIGPAGWLIAGLGLAAAAFFGLSAAANDGEAQLRKFRLEIQQLSLDEARRKVKELRDELEGMRTLSQTEIVVMGATGLGRDILGSRDKMRKSLEGRIQALNEFIAAEEKAMRDAAAKQAQAAKEDAAAKQAQAAKELEKVKELLDNQRQFEFEHQQISRAQFISYLEQRRNDFTKFSNEWIALTEALEKQQAALQVERFAAQQEIQNVELETVREHNRKLELINTDSGNKRLAESRKFGEQMLQEQEARTQQMINQAFFLSDALSNIGMAFVEGVKGRANEWTAAMKQFLIAAIEAVEKYFIVAKIKTILDAVINPFAALKNAAPLIAALAGLQVAKAQIAALAEGSVISKPTLALIGEDPRSKFEVVAPERDFMSFSQQLIDRVMSERSSTSSTSSLSGRRGGVTIVNNFNTPLNDRKTAERLTDEVLKPEVKRENGRRAR